MSELNDSSELQKYSSAVLYVLSAVNPPPDYVEIVAEHFLSAIRSSDVSSLVRMLYRETLKRTVVVVACPSKGFAHLTRLLLQEFDEYFGQHCHAHDGRFT